MPKFEFKKITRPVDLSNYAAEYSGASFQVWVNPSRVVLADWYEMRAAYVELISEAQTQPSNEAMVLELRGARFVALNARINAWLATLWSQDEDADTHWTSEEVDQLVTTMTDTDPQAWAWLLNECLTVIQNYRSGERKN
jgi:hypothetical protein